MGDIAPATRRRQAMSLKKVASKFTYAALAWRELCTLAEHRVIVNGKRATALETGMDDWDNFYMLAGGTAGTLIGLIFVVITLGMDHAQEGDTLRIRIFVTPILVYFASLLVISMVMVPPMAPWRAPSRSEPSAALALPMCCTSRIYRASEAKPTDEQDASGTCCCRLRPSCLTVIAAIAWALEASFANSFNAIGVVILLVTALRKSWIVTLVIATRD